MGKFFTVEVKPVLPVATQIQADASDLVFGSGDVLFNWTSFNIPKGAARLVDITTIIRGSQTLKAIDLFFAKTYNSTAPGDLGTGNADADGVGYYKNIIGALAIPTGEWKEDLNNLVIASSGHGAGANQIPGIVLEGEPNTGVNVGYDTIYIGATVGASSGWNLSTGVLANAGVTLGAADTFVTKTVDPRLFFDIGDVVHVHDSDTAIGTVKSLTNDDINLEAVTGVAISADDEIINASPIKIILSFER